MRETFCSGCGKELFATDDDFLNSIRIEGAAQEIAFCATCALPFVELLEKKWLFIQGQSAKQWPAVAA